MSDRFNDKNVGPEHLPLKRGRPTRYRVRGGKPLTHAENALMQIKDLPDIQKERVAVDLLVGMLLRDEDLRESLLESIASYFVEEEQDEEMEVNLTPEMIQEGFKQLFQSYNNAQSGSGGRRPERAERIYEVIRGRENEEIPLEDFTANMPPTVKNPHRQVSRDIFQINADFKKFDIPLSITGASYGAGESRKTVYRISIRPQNITPR